MNVTLYTTPTCGYCRQLKAYLRQRGVPFIEHDVSRDRQAAIEMVRLSGQQGVPVAVINGQVVVGFNRPLIDRLLARPKLGLAIAPAERIAAKKGLALPSGAYVGRVDPGSPADRAGLRPGDVITRMAGHPVRSDADVHRLLTGVRPGQDLPLTFWRDGRETHTTVRL